MNMQITSFAIVTCLFLLNLEDSYGSSRHKKNNELPSKSSSLSIETSSEARRSGRLDMGSPVDIDYEAIKVEALKIKKVIDKTWLIKGINWIDRDAKKGLRIIAIPDENILTEIEECLHRIQELESEVVRGQKKDNCVSFISPSGFVINLRPGRDYFRDPNAAKGQAKLFYHTKKTGHYLIDIIGYTSYGSMHGQEKYVNSPRLSLIFLDSRERFLASKDYDMGRFINMTIVDNPSLLHSALGSKFWSDEYLLQDNNFKGNLQTDSVDYKISGTSR